MERYTYPPPKTGEPAPIWTGSTFMQGAGASSRVLAYGVDTSGWSDELTDLHEAATESGAHFIDVASRRRALDELKRLFQTKAASVLEVGCSAGHLLRDIGRELPNIFLTGGDYTLGTLTKLGDRFPGIPLIRFDLSKSPLPDNTFDAIVLLNVLEHIEDDTAAAHHIARMLVPGGAAVIEVPAGPELFDDYDRQLQHFRRYTLKGIRDLVARAGLEIESANYFGALLYPAFYAAKKWSQKNPKPADSREKHVSSSIELTSRLNFLGAAIMQLESRLSRAVTFPRGVRCVVTARKPV